MHEMMYTRKTKNNVRTWLVKNFLHLKTGLGIGRRMRIALWNLCEKSVKFLKFQIPCVQFAVGWDEFDGDPRQGYLVLRASVQRAPVPVQAGLYEAHVRAHSNAARHLELPGRRQQHSQVITRGTCLDNSFVIIIIEQKFAARQLGI